LKEQREDLRHRAAAAGEAESDSPHHDLFRWYATEIDSLLDQHAGAAWLRDERVASLVAGALRYFDAQRYSLHSWCVMPNHVHAVVRPLGMHSLDEILHSWKSYTASKANELLDRKGQPFWQHESYDHWIRDDADFQHCCFYTEENPVKAGLVGSALEWRWGSAFG
jgi:REP element-mobilizing transposase RayT